MSDQQPHARVSRRSFLTAVGAATTATGLAMSAAEAAAPVESWDEASRWDRQADLVVCGGGAAGFAAAVIAAAGGAKTILVEKAATVGGTTAKSGGAWWSPGNKLMIEKGYKDPRDDVLAFMARLSMPGVYDPTQPRFGLDAFDYESLESYIDNARRATDELVAIGALKVALYQHESVGLIPDYFSDLPENKAPVGRGLIPALEDGTPSISGMELIRQLSRAAERLGVVVLTGHAVAGLVRRGDRIIGIKANTDDGSVHIGGGRGVVLATGGFTHNPRLAENFLLGPIFGGCAVPQNTGDIIPIATGAGAALGNMANAWWAEVVVEQALDFSSVPSDAFVLSGDSMVSVNRYGKRLYNEKSHYNERTRAHFIYDPVAADYPNLLAFMIYDDRTAQNPGNWVNFPLPAKGYTAPYVITAPTIQQLVVELRKRIASLAGRSSVSARISSALSLADDFEAELTRTIAEFNAFARAGKDPMFHRGETLGERTMPPSRPNGLPNPTMHPIADKGPYHCIILGAGTLDTKGGPVVNGRGEILDAEMKPIPGLYGAGNCIASPAAQAYWSGGATIGAALGLGYAAARSALGTGGGESAAG